MAQQMILRYDDEFGSERMYWRPRNSSKDSLRPTGRTSNLSYTRRQHHHGLDFQPTGSGVVGNLAGVSRPESNSIIKAHIVQINS